MVSVFSPLIGRLHYDNIVRKPHGANNLIEICIKQGLHLTLCNESKISEWLSKILLTPLYDKKTEVASLGSMRHPDPGFSLTSLSTGLAFSSCKIVVPLACACVPDQKNMEKGQSHVTAQVVRFQGLSFLEALLSDLHFHFIGQTVSFGHLQMK